jgi:excisionase family DNA binding protein
MLQREGFVTVKEAAELLDVAPNTVRAWGAAGSITEYRHPVNNYRLYKRDELEKVIRKLLQPVRITRKKKPR